jgi:hypothetical protein
LTSIVDVSTVDGGLVDVGIGPTVTVGAADAAVGGGSVGRALLNALVGEEAGDAVGGGGASATGGVARTSAGDGDAGF